jgi:hypothetical protein
VTSTDLSIEALRIIEQHALDYRRLIASAQAGRISISDMAQQAFDMTIAANLAQIAANRAQRARG